MAVVQIADAWWRDKATLEAEIAKHGSNRAISQAHDGTPSETVVRKWRQLHGLGPSTDRGAATPDTAKRAALASAGDDKWLLKLLKKQGDNATVEDLADAADVSPKRVRDALTRLGESGFRVHAADERIVIDRVPPQKDNLHQLTPALFDGELLRVGVVSDTHLGANEEALAELHLAYDIFQREGISEVWHAGDWGTGVGMFRTHHSEAHVHTSSEQVDYLVDNYPARPGIRTKGIAGNHDLEGDFGRIGFDPVAALANRRDDIDYLGEYGAWLELRPGTGSWVHLLHGAGGMSYAYSYKAQKIVDGYPAGRKPAVTIVGHWHVRGNFQARNVELVFPGCFEWQSRFMQRLGLQPAVGFHIIEMRVADDGSVVEFTPRWFPYYAGRTLEKAA